MLGKAAKFGGQTWNDFKVIQLFSEGASKNSSPVWIGLTKLWPVVHSANYHKWVNEVFLAKRELVNRSFYGWFG